MKVGFRMLRFNIESLIFLIITIVTNYVFIEVSRALMPRLKKSFRRIYYICIFFLWFFLISYATEYTDSKLLSAYLPACALGMLMGVMIGSKKATK